MKAEEIKEGDIVELDYIERFTKKHIKEGKALVIWKGFNHQPLVLESLLDEIDGLEPYQRYELLHERKKPRGSIRRKRKRRIVYAKDCLEIGEALYKGMMDGFEIEEKKESDNNDEQP